MHICKRTLTLLLTLCLAAATLPAVGLAADAGGSAAAVCDFEDEFKEKSSSGRYR